MDKIGLDLMRRLVAEAIITAEKVGLCEYDINICICKLANLIDISEAYLSEQYNQKCTICNETILRDESYIQNCDGVQHIDCYIMSSV